MKKHFQDCNNFVSTILEINYVVLTDKLQMYGIKLMLKLFLFNLGSGFLMQSHLTYYTSVDSLKDQISRLFKVQHVLDLVAMMDKYFNLPLTSTIQAVR